MLSRDIYLWVEGASHRECVIWVIIICSEQEIGNQVTESETDEAYKDSMEYAYKQAGKKWTLHNTIILDYNAS